MLTDALREVEPGRRSTSVPVAWFRFTSLFATPSSMWVACDSMVCTEPTGVPIVMSLAVMPPVLFTLKVVMLLSRSIASITSTPTT